MPFEKIQSEKLSRAVERQLESLILHGILRPGERLPAERDLAERLGVSRPSLREALGQLQDRGLLTARPGAGIYVADVLGSAFSPALVDLFNRHEDALADYVAFRRDMEGLAAERAARLASDTDLKLIATLFHRMEEAHGRRNPADEAALDADFHMAITEAGHNVIMLHMMRSMYDLLRQGVFYNRQVMFPDGVSRGALLEQHRAMNAALQARDPVAARAAVETHLDYVLDRLRAAQLVARNEQVARQRLDQAAQR